jgi:hypothetical protein
LQKEKAGVISMAERTDSMRISRKHAEEIYENPLDLQFVLGGDYKDGFMIFVNLLIVNYYTPIFTTALFKTREEAVEDLRKTLQSIVSLKQPSNGHQKSLTKSLIEKIVKELAYEDVVTTRK